MSRAGCQKQGVTEELFFFLLYIILNVWIKKKR